MSKDIKPKKARARLAASRRNRIIAWTVFLAAGGVGGVYGYRYATQETKVEVPVAKSADVPNS